MGLIFQLILRFGTIFLIPLFNILKNFGIKFIVGLGKNAFSFRNIFWTFIGFFPFIFKKIFVIFSLIGINNLVLKKLFSILIIYTFISFFIGFFLNPISFVFYHLHISLNYFLSFFILHSTLQYIYSVLFKFFVLLFLGVIIYDLYTHKD